MLQDLTTQGDEITGGGVWRRRANSETAAAAVPRMSRVLSESDLQRIDRDATFKSAAALVQPGELLAHVVHALGGEEQGVQGFSDAEILASEEPAATWNIGGEAIPRQRGRAASDVRIPMREHQDAEWTWSGDEPSRRVHELFRARHKRWDFHTVSVLWCQVACSSLQLSLSLFLAAWRPPITRTADHPSSRWQRPDSNSR
jgi:hypothetical protein